MILTGDEIVKEIKKKRIIIDPFNKQQVNPNSYNFKLGNTIKIYKRKTLDPKKKNETTEIEIPKKGLLLKPNMIYLAHTFETMGSCHYVPILRGRSSIGRLGLFVHITADLIDIGSINQWTLMLHAVQEVIIYPGMLIGQVTFWKVKGNIVLYKGKYQGSKGPMESMIYKDFIKK